MLRLKRKGFEGLFYSGILGKARFFFESTLGHDELVFTASPQTFRNIVVRENLTLELRTVRDFAALAPFSGALASAYYPGYVNQWRGPFTWGERVVLGLVDNELASFAWIQSGVLDGFPTHYCRLFDREARILRLGVLPLFRRRGVSTLMLQLLLRGLFTSGTSRVYIECHKHNLPSARSVLHAGFRPFGVIRVLEFPPMRGFIRWRSVRSVASEFRKLGVELEPPAPVAGDNAAGSHFYQPDSTGTVAD